jgi:peptide/nickel transport system substrate-binding protein
VPISNGDLVPVLAAAIPTVDNGGVAPDGKSVTWTLQAQLAMV